VYKRSEEVMEIENDENNKCKQLNVKETEPQEAATKCIKNIR